MVRNAPKGEENHMELLPVDDLPIKPVKKKRAKGSTTQINKTSDVPMTKEIAVMSLRADAIARMNESPDKDKDVVGCLLWKLAARLECDFAKLRPEPKLATVLPFPKRPPVDSEPLPRNYHTSLPTSY